MCEALPPTLKKKTKTERREHKTHFLFPRTEVTIRDTEVWRSVYAQWSSPGVGMLEEGNRTSEPGSPRARKEVLTLQPCSLVACLQPCSLVAL